MREVLEDETYGTVTIGGQTVVGFISDVSCPECASILVYHEIFDAHFCPQCDEWREKECSDPDCRYCKNRPAKPLNDDVPA